MTTDAGVDAGLDAPPPSGECSNVNIWDTEYHSPRESLGLFRDAVRNALMPWTPDLAGISDFSARVESTSLSRGYVNRIRVTPHRSVRTPSDVRCSPHDCLYVGLDLAGPMQADQGGHNTAIRAGDLLLTRSDIPKHVAHEPGPPHQALILVIPKDEFDGAMKDERYYTNFVIPHEKIIRPLSSCLSFLSERLLCAPRDELSGILDAVISLLPVAAGHGQNVNDLTSSSNAALLRELIHFIDTTISNSDLSPRMAAAHLGISPRYVHKLFAGCGVTFSSFVMAKRLDHIRQELLSPSCRKQSIAALAYRWGFEDLSTFNRAYKHRFNCTPSQSRQRGR